MEKQEVVETLKTFKPLKYESDIKDKLDLVKAIEKAISEYTEEEILDLEESKWVEKTIKNCPYMRYEVDEKEFEKFIEAIKALLDYF